MQLNPQQRQKLLESYPELGKFFEAQDKKEEKKESVLPPEIVAKIKAVKGDVGEKGDKGDAGYTPVKGKDYWTKEDTAAFEKATEALKTHHANVDATANEILKKATPVKGIHYRDGKDGKDGLDGKDGKRGERGFDGIGVQGIKGKDGSPDTPEQIAEKLNSLKGRVDVSVVKGAVSKKEVDDGMTKVDGRIKLLDQKWHGGGLSKVSTDNTLTGNGTASSPLSVVGGGSGITQINSDATAHQTLTTGTTGTDFAIVDNGTGDHKFNLPVASASNTGKLSSTDWSTFNGKQNTLTLGNLTDVGTDGITIGSGTGAVVGSGTTISQHVADTTHSGYLSSTDWNTFNGKGSGTVTAIGVTTANGVSGTSSGGATPNLTIALGAITPTTVNGNTITTGTGILTLGAGKTLKVDNTLELAGTDSTTMTFPSTTATIARTDAAQTFVGIQTIPQILCVDNLITASGNAATVDRTNRNNVVTNNSAATLTITLSTTSATGGDMVLVQVLDASGVAQTITWVNTENSTVTAPTTSNGSTTLPLTIGFKWNTQTSKWRCIASA